MYPSLPRPHWAVIGRLVGGCGAHANERMSVPHAQKYIYICIYSICVGEREFAILGSKLNGIYFLFMAPIQEFQITPRKRLCEIKALHKIVCAECFANSW